MTQVLCAASLKAEWTSKEVVPDVIDDAPPDKLEIEYSGTSVKEGCTVTPKEAKDPPSICWEVKDKTFYTLCMIDLDVPCRNNPVSRELCHWLVVNIPEENIEDGDTLVEYIGPAPPKGNGFHRFVFLLYKQPDEIDCSGERTISNTCAEGRLAFCITSFAKKYKLGEPIRGNFFQAEYDSQVRVVRQQMGF
ncbi:hypothetical protein NQ317_009631 [Molorchus minor]|uniref:Uncharacterized protein n=1 Tax=Molorchus minor TaxID=1323400 RepID=A0ABQ9IVN9_9CUCU|nr:hypothetical protein NQ317_009631 [Molorchus minor]